MFSLEMHTAEWFPGREEATAAEMFFLERVCSKVPAADTFLLRPGRRDAAVASSEAGTFLPLIPSSNGGSTNG